MNLYLVLGAEKGGGGMKEMVDALKERPLKLLISYWYYKDIDLDKAFKQYFPDNHPQVFADSGAFSAMTQGQPIKIDNYISWVQRWKHHFEVYANLDVIGNAEKTWENQKNMENAGLKPLPVFHVMEDFDWLKKYIAQYKYIGLGGICRFSRRKYHDWLKMCFLLKNGTQFHGFGITNQIILRKFEWFSVDSSSWMEGFRHGNVPVFDSSSGKMLNLRLGQKKDWFQHFSLVRSLGFNPIDFADRKRNKRHLICKLSARSFLEFEHWINQNRKCYLYLCETNKQFKDILSGAIK